MAIPMGYQQITSVSSSTALTVPTQSTTPGGSAAPPTYCRVIPEAQAVRWRDDGIAPTATVGMPLAVGAELRYDGNLSKIRFFEQTGGAILNVSYYIG